MRNLTSEVQEPAFRNRPGAYQLAIRAPKTEIDPGDDIILEIYVTGYGEIRGAKVVFYPPTNFVSYTQVDGWAAVKAMIIGRGGARGLTNHAVIIPLAADERDDPYGWRSDTDPHGIDTSAIAAEARFSAPIRLTLGTKPQYVEPPPTGETSIIDTPIPPGNHTFQVFLTYFNGSEWKTDSQSVTVSVRNWFQRNYYATLVVSILGVGLTLIALAVSVMVNLGALWDLISAIFHVLTGG